MRDSSRPRCDTTLVSQEDDHCQRRVWPPALGLSIPLLLETAPILPLWKVQPGQNNAALEQDSDLTRRRERAPRLRTAIYRGAFSFERDSATHRTRLLSGSLPPVILSINNARAWLLAPSIGQVDLKCLRSEGGGQALGCASEIHGHAILVRQLGMHLPLDQGESAADAVVSSGEIGEPV